MRTCVTAVKPADWNRRNHSDILLLRKCEKLKSVARLPIEITHLLKGIHLMAPAQQSASGTAGPANSPSKKRTSTAGPVRVAIAEGRGKSSTQLLDHALTRAHFWRNLDTARRQSGRRRADFRVAIKPDLDFFDLTSPTGTSPELVEALVRRLFDRGYGAVTVFDGRNIDDSWLHNRAPLSVPDLVGYRFTVDNGQSYDVVGLDEELTHPVFPDGHPLYRYGMCGPWFEADYRIVFAKNKTDEDCGFALGAFNLLGCLPEALRNDFTSADMQLPEVCLAVLRCAPIHFCLIDAVTSSHGSAGSRVPCPIESSTIIASPSLLLADWVGAVKMGMDSHASPINALALREIGLPEEFHIEGDLAAYPMWKNPHPLVVKSARGRGSQLARLTRPLLQPVDREAFPFRDLPLDRCNAFLAQYCANGGGDGPSNWLPVGLNYALAALDNVAQSVNMMYQKRNLRWIERPLQFDYEAVPQADYDRVRKYVSGLEQLVQGAPTDRHGNHWRTVDGAILFLGRQILPTAYSEFIENVEIHRSIQFMNDYIGGSAVGVTRRRDGRVTRQAERNLYLPQPNWTVLFGGKMIDVEKIEVIAYADNWQKIWWRTVASPNNSAELDDGSVEFRRTVDGLTQVTVFTRQKFNLPPALAALQIENYPEVHDALVAAAYHNFFINTIRNLHLKADGLPYRIGRQDPPASGSAVADLSVWLATVAAALTELFGQQYDVWRSIQRFFAPDQPTPDESPIDEHGFRHFTAPPRSASSGSGRDVAFADLARSVMTGAPEFFAGLADAIRNDVSLAAAGGKGTANGNGAKP